MDYSEKYQELVELSHSVNSEIYHRGDNFLSTSISFGKESMMKSGATACRASRVLLP